MVAEDSVTVFAAAGSVKLTVQIAYASQTEATTAKAAIEAGPLLNSTAASELLSLPGLAIAVNRIDVVGTLASPSSAPQGKALNDNAIIGLATGGAVLGCVFVLVLLIKMGFVPSPCPTKAMKNVNTRI